MRRRAGRGALISSSGKLPAPIISAIAANYIVNSQTSETITWHTNISGTSRVDYGLTSSYGSTTSNATLTKNHSITLTGLTAFTTYHYRVRSTNASGIETISGDMTFVTPRFQVNFVDTPSGNDGYSVGAYIDYFLNINPDTFGSLTPASQSLYRIDCNMQDLQPSDAASAFWFVDPYQGPDQNNTTSYYIWMNVDGNCFDATSGQDGQGNNAIGFECDVSSSDDAVALAAALTTTLTNAGFSATNQLDGSLVFFTLAYGSPDYVSIQDYDGICPGTGFGLELLQQGIDPSEFAWNDPAVDINNFWTTFYIVDGASYSGPFGGQFFLEALNNLGASSNQQITVSVNSSDDYATIAAKTLAVYTSIGFVITGSGTGTFSWQATGPGNGESIFDEGPGTGFEFGANNNGGYNSYFYFFDPIYHPVLPANDNCVVVDYVDSTGIYAPYPGPESNPQLRIRVNFDEVDDQAAVGDKTVAALIAAGWTTALNSGGFVTWACKNVGVAHAPLNGDFAPMPEDEFGSGTTVQGEPLT